MEISRGAVRCAKTIIKAYQNTITVIEQLETYNITVLRSVKCNIRIFHG